MKKLSIILFIPFIKKSLGIFILNMG